MKMVVSIYSLFRFLTEPLDSRRYLFKKASSLFGKEAFLPPSAYVNEKIMLGFV